MDRCAELSQVSQRGHLARNCPQKDGIGTAVDLSMIPRRERTPVKPYSCGKLEYISMH